MTQNRIASALTTFKSDKRGVAKQLLARSLFTFPLLIAACAGPRMVPPADVAQGTVLDVKNRSGASGSFVKEDFDLGSYKVAKVDRSWVHGNGFGAGAYSTHRSTAGYTYELQGGAQTWKGTCAISKDEKNVSMGGGLSFGGSKASLTCECAGGAQPGSLELTRDRSGNFTGKVSPAGQGYALGVVKETDKKYWGGEPAGYRFDGTDGPRGAVETMNPGRIWYTEKMAAAEREPGTCLLAGLMLYKEPADQDK
jgi:hypothetical protein